jgi:hypothetical protein
MSIHNIALVYLEEIENIYQTEMVDAQKEGDHYRMVAPPFFAKNLAIGDLIAVEDDDGVHYFDDLIERSGRSTVRILFWDESIINTTLEEIKLLGAEVYTLPQITKYVALDIPAEIDYSTIEELLNKGKINQLWDFEEACLGWK